MNTGDRRAQNVAALGFCLSLAAFGTLLGVSIWSHSDATSAVARFAAAGLPVWAILFLVFHQIHRVQKENLETAELQRAQAGGLNTSIFEVGQESLLIEQGRLHWMVRWLLPSVSVVLTVYLLVGQFLAWNWSLEKAFDPSAIRRTEHPTLMMWFVVGVGFLCFLYARYVLALARLPEWRLLHAGGAFMAGNALLCLGLVIALMSGTALPWVEPFLAYAVRILLGILGVEIAINFIFDFYRPRTPGEVPRPSFDSRLLGLISDPGGIAKSIADTINYQFGFEVSSTWFYQLLQRWLFPIVVAAAAIVVALTSLVIVAPYEQAVVERAGRPLEGGGVLGPGLHLKWPWPIERVLRAPVKQINEVVVGEATQEDEDPKKAIVWTEAHDFVPELMLLVASRPLEARAAVVQDETPRTGRSVAVNLLMVSVPIEFRIRDIRQYLYSYAEPRRLLEAVAHQFLSDYAAGVDIDEFIGPGRERLNAELHKGIQSRLDALGLGIEIVFAGIRSAHPPAQEKVADSFHAVVSAKVTMAATIHAAEGEGQRILTAVAGTEARAKALDKAILAVERLSRDPTAGTTAKSEADEKAGDLLMGNPDKGIPPMSGRAAAIVADARAATREWISEEAGKVRSFETEVAAYRAAPALYGERKKLGLYHDLDQVRKYMIVGDPSGVTIHYDTAEQGGLDRVLAEGVEKERKKANP